MTSVCMGLHCTMQAGYLLNDKVSPFLGVICAKHPVLFLKSTLLVPREFEMCSRHSLLKI